MVQKQEELEIYDKLNENYEFLTDGQTGKLYWKSDNQFKEISDAQLNMMIVDEYIDQELKYSRQKKGIVIDMIKAHSYLNPDIIYSTTENTIPLYNGVYKLDGYFTIFNPNVEGREEKKRFKHYPIANYFNFNKLPVSYDPEADNPIMEQFLIDVFGEDKLDLIYEWIGYLLLPHVKYQRAMILVGSGKNGKTTFLDMLITFLGLDNVCQIPLQELDNRFEMINLKGKYANIVADLPSKELKDSGNAKRIVTDKTLESSIKNVQGRFSFVNRTKNLYACNKLPRNKDKSRAFYRRWSLFVCSNTFEGNCNPHMLEMITTQEELSGLLNKAIFGIIRLQEKGGFPDTTEDVKAIWEMDSNPVASFIHSQTRTKSGSEIRSIDLFNRFNEWRALKELPLLDSRSIGYWMRQHGIVGKQRPDKNDVDKYGNPKWYTFYQNIEFKEKELTLQPKKKRKGYFIDTFGVERNI